MEWVGLPYNPPMNKEEVVELVKQYSSETGHFSFSQTKHPAYVKLKAAGADIIPFLLERLRDSVGHDYGKRMDHDNSPWLSLDIIQELTNGECFQGFPEKHAGMLDQVRKFVLKWGKTRGLLT